MSRRLALRERILVVFGLVDNARDALNAPLPAAAMQGWATSALVPESESLEPKARADGQGTDLRVAVSPTVAWEERVVFERDN